MLTNAAVLRAEMVSQQIKARGIHDAAILEAMNAVPREAFLPDELAEFAYEDSPLPIAEQQTVPQPYIIAGMIDALELAPGMRVLELGTSSGYTTAILAQIASDVFTVESFPVLANVAEQRLRRLGYHNVWVRGGDTRGGWPEQAPYDAILLHAGGLSVARAVQEQLAPGGRLVFAEGEFDRVLRLRRICHVHGAFEEEDLGQLHYLPVTGTEALRESQPVTRRRRETPEDVIAARAEPFDSIESADLDGLIQRIGGARVILLGEASHGTAEFYDMRARITAELIARGAVSIVAVEADWPDARQIDRYIRGEAADPHPERAFGRFPTWMWANRQVLAFARWLQQWNRSRGTAGQVGFYGLDLYSLYHSIDAVLAYLDEVDPQAADVARARYGCLSPWEGNPAAYGAAALRGSFESCAPHTIGVLQQLLQHRLEYEQADGERFFNAERNAHLIKNAENYYRAMYHGSVSSWNLRDRHMFETLLSLLEHRGKNACAVVWAHNSHLGDASATEMGVRGETNVGEMCRKEFGEQCYAIGFGTDHGTVAAAHDWGDPVQVMDVRPAHRDSYEYLCHSSGAGPRFMLPLRERDNAAACRVLEGERLERAIGVIYRPHTELASHYFHSCLPRQFDEWIWFDESHAVEPIAVPSEHDEAPETFPFGL